MEGGGEVAGFVVDEEEAGLEGLEGLLDKEEGVGELDATEVEVQGGGAGIGEGVEIVGVVASEGLGGGEGGGRGGGEGVETESGAGCEGEKS